MTSSLMERIASAKLNRQAMDSLIRGFRAFILSELSRNLHRQVDGEHDEMLTLGMMAFYEAVNSYNENKGAFIPHARLIIRRRVIDELRRLNPGDLTENFYDDEVISQISVDRYSDETEQLERIEAISDFSEKLRKFGITFDELEKKSPKNDKIKFLYQCMAKKICDDQKICDQVLIDGKLPVRWLSETFLVNRRKIDRGRVYILACILVKEKKYEAINGFMIGGDCLESNRT